jgi:hypothetical protein
MKVYLPHTYKEWLDTNPPEGEIMVIAFLTKLAAIYGVETYFEMYYEDLDVINHTEIKGQTQQMLRHFKAQGLIKQANGIALRTTLRLADHKIEPFNRATLLTDSLPYQLSFSGALIWTYLMGRMAGIDDQIEISVLNKVREYGNTKNAAKFRGVEKTATTHILPVVYAKAFIKETGQIYESAYQEKPINMTRKEYAKWYYQQRRQDVLTKKKSQYKNKKTDA